MAKYIGPVLTIIFIIVSINNQSVLSIKSDPSLEIIKQEDAEEGYFTRDQGILLNIL